MGTNKTIKDAQTALTNLKGALAQDRKAGFKAATGVTGAIYGNLRTTQAGIAQQLTGTQKRMLAGVDRIGQRLGNLKTGEKAARGTFGVEVGRFFDPAQAQAQAGKLIGTANVRAGLEQYKGVKEAGDVAASSAAEAQAGAQYATAAALSQRTTADAATIAQQELALAQMQAQFQHDKEMAAIQHQNTLDEIEAQTDAADPTGTTKGQVLQLSTTAGATFQTAQQLFNTEKTDADGKPTGEYMNAQEVTAAILGQMSGSGQPVDDATTRMVQSVVGAMWSAGAGKAPGQLYGQRFDTKAEGDAFRTQLVLSAVKTTLTSLYPNYGKWMDDISSSINSWMVATEPFNPNDYASGDQGPGGTAGKWVLVGEGEDTHWVFQKD